MDKRNQPHHQQEMFETDRPGTRDSGPVTCLGITFPNDEKRREYFLEKLHEKLKDPEFRKIEGFPIGEDEDILALSDPPYYTYTTCPNPFIEDFIKHYGNPYDPANDDYRREPFAADVSEGKNAKIYRAHSYHTKVPPKAIVPFIQHFTGNNGVVLDAFAGSGMTGLAGQEIDTPVLLCDLAPGATFIAHNYNSFPKASEIKKALDTLIKEVRKSDTRENPPGGPQAPHVVRPGAHQFRGGIIYAKNIER